MSSNSPSCHSNFYKRRLIYSGSGDALVNVLPLPMLFPQTLPLLLVLSLRARPLLLPQPAGALPLTPTPMQLSRHRPSLLGAPSSIHSLLMLLLPLPLPTSYTSTSAQYVFGPPSSTFMLVHHGANDSSSGTCGMMLQLEEPTTPWREEYAATTL